MSIKLINRRVVLRNGMGLLWSLPLAGLLKANKAFGAAAPATNFKYLVCLLGDHSWGDLSAFIPGIRPWRPYFSDNPTSPIGGDQEIGITRDPRGVRYWPMPNANNAWGAWKFVDANLYAAYKNRTAFFAGLSPAASTADAHRINGNCAFHLTGNYNTNISSVSIDSIFAFAGVNNGLISNTQYPVFNMGSRSNRVTVPYGSNVPVGPTSGITAQQIYASALDSGARLSANQATSANFQASQRSKASIIDLFKSELTDLKNSGLITSVPDLQAYLESVRYIENSYNGAQNPIPAACQKPSGQFGTDEWTNNLTMITAMLSCGMTNCVTVDFATPYPAATTALQTYVDYFNATAGFGKRMSDLYKTSSSMGADYNGFMADISADLASQNTHNAFHHSASATDPAYQLNAAFINQGYQLMNALSQIPDVNYGGTIGSNTAIVLMREAGLNADAHSSSLAAMVIGGDDNKMLNAGYIYDYMDYDFVNHLRMTPKSGAAYTYNHFLVSMMQSLGLKPADYNPPGQTGFGTYLSTQFTSTQGLTNSLLVRYGDAPAITLLTDPARRDEPLPKAFTKT